MIRRELNDHVAWISQAQRCRLAATLAEHIGNQQFLALSPKVTLAAANLDAGWTVLDSDPPARDSADLERATLLDLWQASGQLAAAVDPYAGLLVTLAGFWKSMTAGASGLSHWDVAETRVRFDLNRFQHTMIELLESLRVRCGLRVDKPLKFGLAEHSRDPLEKQLRVDFGWLQLLDTFSEALCRGRSPARHLHAFGRGSNQPIELTAEVHAARASVNPWPFDRARIDLPIEYRRSGGSGVAPATGTFTIALAAFTI